jgi:flagellar biosynthesis protein FlhF
MQIKRFEAKDMTEALKMIKKEFGSEAVILSAKTLKKSGGLFGAVRKACVEITAASDHYRSIDLKAQLPIKGYNDLSKSQHSSSTVNKVSNLNDKLDKDGSDCKPKFSNQLENHFESPLIKKFYLSLKEQGLADLLIHRIIDEISFTNKHNQSVSFKEIKNDFYQAIDDRVMVAEQLGIKEGKPNIVAFVGPSGVGKTTTIAKLSAINMLEEKYSVALISLDHQRIGATSTLEKYAGIIGLPYKTVQSEKELKSIIAQFKKKQLIFVDTPGIAVMNKEGIAKLAKQLNSISPSEVHLLISATTKDKDMVCLCSAYAPCQVNRLIFTKIDETSEFGNLLNLLENKKIPLAYVTNGQQIPEDIIQGQSKTIADLLFFHTNVRNSSERKIKTKRSVETYQSVFSQSCEYYIANKNSDIFHHRMCKSVERINMNNVIIFKNISDALEKKFKPCRMCCHEKNRNDQLMQRFNQKVAIS